MFFTWGYVNAFGVYENYYLTHQLSDKSPDDIAWIGSISVFFFFASGLISGPFVDRFGPSYIVWPASLLFALSVMLTSLCTEYWHFILCQGLFGGMTSGLCFTPALTVVGHYFLQKRAPMMALSATGSALGGIIIPIILNELLHKDGVSFGWTVRAIGFIMLALALCASLSIRPRLPPRPGTYFQPAAFKSAPFSLQIASVFLVVLGLMTPFFYLPTFALEVVHMDADLSFYIIAIMNAGSFVGRFAAGFASRVLGKFNIYIVAQGVCALLLFVWLAIDSQGGVIAFALLYGASSGAVIAMMPACFAETAPEPRFIGTYMGMGMGISALPALTGTPINGRLLANYGSFDQPAIFSGSVVVAGTLLMLATRYAYIKQKGVTTFAV
jgi:MFS family permease